MMNKKLMNFDKASFSRGKKKKFLEKKLIIKSKERDEWEIEKYATLQFLFIHKKLHNI
jgi:hypothetical protein